MALRLGYRLKKLVSDLPWVINYRLFRKPLSRREVIEAFHRLYYDEKVCPNTTWQNTRWFGTPVLKCPLDLWIYQEILAEIKPDLILETGTYRGGSALYLAALCDILGCGEIYTVDIRDDRPRPPHPRVRYLTGSSTSPEITAVMQARVREAERVLVILDSIHHADHVLEELRIYSRWVTPGSYLIVEDTNLYGLVNRAYGPGPMEALEVFLKENTQFESDRTREKFHMTFNPRGYLKRIS